MVFQEVKQMLENRQYAEITDGVYQDFIDEIHTLIAGSQYGEWLPQDYSELREWVYVRVAKDMIYQDSGFLNDHFCIGVIYGMLRICDDQFNQHYWNYIYNSVRSARCQIGF